MAAYENTRPLPEDLHREEENAEAMESEALVELKTAEEIAGEAKADELSAAREARAMDAAIGSEYELHRNVEDTIDAAREAADAASEAADAAAMAARDAKVVAVETANASEEANAAAEAAENMAKITSTAAKDARHAVGGMAQIATTMDEVAKETKTAMAYGQEAIIEENEAIVETIAHEE